MKILSLKMKNIEIDITVTIFTKHIMFDPSIKNILEKDVFKICEDYMKTIEWTFQYYFKECPAWRWYYKHDFAPLIIDLSNHLKKNKKQLSKKSEPYSPQEQLKIVLPNLEKNFMYPSDTPNYTFLKTYDWECHSILPIFNAKVQVFMLHVFVYFGTFDISSE